MYPYVTERPHDFATSQYVYVIDYVVVVFQSSRITKCHSGATKRLRFYFLYLRFTESLCALCSVVVCSGSV